MSQRKLLTAPTISPAQLAEQFTQSLVKNKDHPELDFTMMVPNGWSVEAINDVPGEDNPLAVLARATPGGDQPPSFEILVWCVNLTREMHPADWLRSWTKSQQLSVIDGRTMPSPLGLSADILAKGTKDDGIWIHRLSTVKDGNKLYLIDTRIRENSPYDDDMAANVGLFALSSFALSNPTGMRFAEEFAQVTLPGDQSVNLLVSTLWQQKFLDDKPPGGAALTLENKVGDEVYGNMIILSEPFAGGSASLEKITLEKLRLSGFEFERSGQGAFENENEFFKYNISVFNGNSPGGAIDIISAQYNSVSMSGLVVMTSLAEKNNFTVWAINRRVFDIVLESLTPVKSA